MESSLDGIIPQEYHSQELRLSQLVTCLPNKTKDLVHALPIALSYGDDPSHRGFNTENLIVQRSWYVRDEQQVRRRSSANVRSVYMIEFICSQYFAIEC
jgi:hypothetical protein